MPTAAPYVPRALLDHLSREPELSVRAVDGTCVFVDVSGFTKLSERLARRGGREGAEQLADAIGSCFENLLGVAYDKGGGLLKFGGDALLLLFDGEAHRERACASAVAMSGRLRELGPIATGSIPVTLRMSVGVHSAEYLLFAVGGSHRELLITGPAASEVVRMEKVAGSGEIVVSATTAAGLPSRCLGPARGAGRLLRSPPPVIRAFAAPMPDTIDSSQAALALSTELRAHVLAGPQPPEHRIVTVAFLRFEGADGLVAERAAGGAADVLHELVTLVQEAADAEQVCFLGSDIDADGGKLILTAGAPRALGDEDERMLLALRHIVEGRAALPLRIGVARGPLFAGDIGPHYRRTYTVMGDVVNLAARLMAKAPPGELYTTPAVVERSSTRFETTALEPFAVRGKALPVEAVSVGPVVLSRDTARGPVPVRFPLVGRDRELEQIARALDDARRGRGRLIQLVSEPGMGRSRLMEEVRDRADGVRVLHATCEPYTMTTPYATWRQLLRDLLGVAGDDTEEVVLARLRATLERDDQSLLPWLPLLADAFDAEAPASPAVDQLSPDFRAARLREVVLRFMRRQLPGWALVEVADAHLMDAASAELVEALARELPLLPWVVVVSRRDRKRGFTATPGEHVLELELAPLVPAESLALAEAATEAAPLPPHIVALAAERSGGSPQFLRDLLRAAAAGSTELPDSIESAALARLDRLAPPDRALIRRASILGLSFHPRQLDDLLGDDVPRPHHATWARLGAYFKAEADGHLRFHRAVVRDVAYAGLPFRVRRELHAVAARQLERELGADADDAAARLAVHFHRAGVHAKAWHYARLAADRASARAAFADAAGLYRRALEAAHQLDIAGEELAAVWESLADAYLRTGEPQRSDHALTAARRLVTDDPVRTAHLLWRHATVAYRAGHISRAVRWSGRALRTLEGVAGEQAAATRSHVVATLANVRHRQGREGEAARLARQAIADAEAAGEELALGHACQILETALVMSGRAAEAGHAARALEIFRRHGAADRESAVLNNMGAFAYRAGRWDDAVTLYRHSGDASLRAGDVNFGAFTDCNVGEVLSDQGRLEEAEPLLRRALQVWRGTADEHGAAFATALLGRLHARSGRNDEAVAMLEDALARARRLGVENDAALAGALLAEAAVFDGRAEEAHERVLALLDAVSDDALLDPLLHHVAGVALAQIGDGEGAHAALAKALQAARASELPLETALALAALELLDPSPERRAELDALLARLDVMRLPGPPLVRPREAAAPVGSR
ncbi:MAG TPA: adenylate/guanylate cyclase domain-containing protein [Solirubrobacteraceae bacterium]|nr:adenylate/guanylate cyclase domain-containing protein [Solirubrobacteraceae bacterium]